MKNQAGLSLLEILIAIALLSFMMLGVIQFTQSSFDTSERVMREDAQLLQIETAMARLEWDFSQVYSPLFFDHMMQPDQMSESEAQAYAQLKLSYESNNRFKNPSYTGLPIPEFFAEDKSTLVLFTNSHRRKLQNAKQSNFSWVKYSLIPNKQTSQAPINQNTTKEAKKSMALTRQVSHRNIYAVEEIDWNRVKPQVLHRKINNLRFEFWDPKNLKWTENLRTITHGRNIIYGLKVFIEFYNADNLLQQTERVFRPLFPSFKPENNYQFLNAAPSAVRDSENTGTSEENSSNSNQTSSGETNE